MQGNQNTPNFNLIYCYFQNYFVEYFMLAILITFVYKIIMNISGKIDCHKLKKIKFLFPKNLFFKIPGQFWRSSVKVEVLTERLKRPKVDGNAKKAHIEYPLVHKDLSLSALQAKFNQKNWADITLFSVHSRLSWLKFSHWTDLTLLKCPCYYRTVFHVIHMCTLHTVYTNTFCIPERAYE